MNLADARQKHSQDKALAILSAFVKRARLGFHDPKRPMGCFMFVGLRCWKTETKNSRERLFDEGSLYSSVCPSSRTK